MTFRRYSAVAALAVGLATVNVLGFRPNEDGAVLYIAMVIAIGATVYLGLNMIARSR